MISVGPLLVVLLQLALYTADDRYQAAARHQQFIEENKANWLKVRVFDSLVNP